ncbi:MAG: Gfo/Idh/MocA family oxidoreductase [Fibrella sp.]|nr:Gfo/Idh/MocA family oxidoreductase [Armatimonadota bacterium]
MSTKSLGVGIVGYGFIGRVHAWAHRSLPFFYSPLPCETRLVGVCTSRPETGEAARREAGFEFAVNDPAELLAHPDIDIIHCCTPNDTHADLLIASLRAGKHIYCDKPLTSTLAEARQVAEAVRNVPTIQRMTFHYRFAPATLRAKELIESGFLGELYQFRAAYLHAGYIDPNRPRTWRTVMAKSGGGAIMDLGVHVFDLARFLIGDFDAVNAQLVTRIPSRPDVDTGHPAPVDVDDIAIVHARTKSGAIGIIEASRLATGVQDELRIELHGSKGMIAWNLMDPNYLEVYDARDPEETLGGNRGVKRIECVSRYPKPWSFKTPKNTIGWNQLHAHSLFDFVRAVAEGDTASGPTFADGFAAQAFVHACQKSANIGGVWIPIETT